MDLENWSTFDDRTLDVSRVLPGPQLEERVITYWSGCEGEYRKGMIDDTGMLIVSTQ